MQLDPVEVISAFQREWPKEFELTVLRLQNRKIMESHPSLFDQADEIVKAAEEQANA